MKIGSNFDLGRSVQKMKEVDETLKEAEALEASLDRKLDATNNVFSDIDPKLKALKESTVNQLAELRKPEMLNTNIVDSLLKNNLTESAWEKAVTGERIVMMNKMFDTMLEKMQVPEEIRKGVQLMHNGNNTVEGNLDGSGQCSRFVDLDQSGAFRVAQKPFVEMHEALSEQSFETALGSLYNQAVKVMQQATCVEPAGSYHDVAEQAKWASEVKDQINGEYKKMSAMQQFADKAEKDFFKRYDNILKVKKAAANDISFKHTVKIK